MAFGSKAEAMAAQARAKRGSFVSINLFGDKETQALLRRLPIYLQKNVVATATKEAFKPAVAAVKAEAMALEAGGGRMAAVARKVRMKAIRRKHNNLGWRVLLPSRVDLGISAWPKERFYYPFAVEFGGKYTPPDPFIYRALMRTRDRVFKKSKELIQKGVRLGWESRA